MNTSESDISILKTLSDREPIFHRPEYAGTLEEFDRMMIPEYWEVGASGKIYSREYILSVLKERLENPQEDIWETEDFKCMHIAGDNYLLTYTLYQGERVTRRATIWRRTGDDWHIVYHQGTIVSD